MKISVITATWNVEQLLEQTLSSIAGQDYANLEMIIVDGGSTDRTLEIARTFTEPGVIIISEPDKGIYDAMNKGVELASGEYVNFMNAGDSFADSDVVRKMVEALTEAPVDYAYGNVVSVYTEGEKLSVARPPEYVWRNKPFNHQALFARRSWLQQVPFDLNLRLVADYDQTYAAYRAGASFRQLPLTVARVNMSDGASKRNYFRMVREKVRVNWRWADNKGKVLAFLAFNLPYLLVIFILSRLGIFELLMVALGRRKQDQSA